MSKPILVTLTGPSCAGKSTLERMLKERGFASAVSTTTRKPRAGEVDGQHYYFVSRDEFDAILAEDGAVEHVMYNGNLYCVTKAEMERIAQEGTPIVVVVDPHGARQFRAFAGENGWNVLSLFVDAPPETIARRFLGRFLEDVEAGNCKAIEAYPARLAEMMTTERGWAEQAYYDVVFDNFDGDATAPVVGFIVSHARAVMESEVEEAA